METLDDIRSKINGLTKTIQLKINSLEKTGFKLNDEHYGEDTVELYIRLDLFNETKLSEIQEMLIPLMIEFRSLRKLESDAYEKQQREIHSQKYF